MRYVLSLSMLLCAHIFVSAQQPIAEAELSFAAMARDSGVRSAFLHYLDTASVTFSKGSIHNGHQQWLQLPEQHFQLLWKPVYYYTALSGNTGFTTGPYEVKAPGSNDVSQAGQFSSIWQKDAAGNWKVLVDIGVTTPTSNYGTVTPCQKANVSGLPSSIGDIREVESLFLKAYQTAGNLAFSEYITDATWFNLEGYPPLHDSTSIMQAMGQQHENITFKPVSGGLSDDRDLGYVYGYTLEGTKRNNYMRVWNHTRAGWKIILQIIQW